MYVLSSASTLYVLSSASTLYVFSSALLSLVGVVVLANKRDLSDLLGLDSESVPKNQNALQYCISYYIIGKISLHVINFQYY